MHPTFCYLHFVCVSYFYKKVKGFRHSASKKEHKMQLIYSLGISSENIGIFKYHDTTKNQLRSYIPITECILSYMLFCSELSSLEKIYYLLPDSLSCINSSKGRNRSNSLPAKSWG